MYFALVELYQTLAEALREALAAADIGRRLGAWRWVVTHWELLDAPPPLARCACCGRVLAGVARGVQGAWCGACIAELLATLEAEGAGDAT